MLLYDRKRFFSKKWMILGAIVLSVLTLAVRMDAIAEVFRGGAFLPEGWCAEFLTKAWSGQAFTFCVPVLCALPGASSFVDEYQSGMCRLALVRVSRRRYLISKAWSAAISGGIVVLTGLLSSALVVFFLFHPLVSADAAEETAEQMTVLIRLLPVLIWMVRYFSLGILGAAAGLAISSAVCNRYMAWLSPFMGEYLLIILYERYLDRMPLIAPKEWLQPSEGWPLQGWSTVIWMWIVSLLLMEAFIKIGEKRLRVL